MALEVPHVLTASLEEKDALLEILNCQQNAKVGVLLFTARFFFVLSV